MVTNGCTGFAQRDDFGVCGRVVVGDVAVPSSAYNPSVAYVVTCVVTYNDRAHRNLPGLKRALGAAQSFFHPKLVRMRFVGRNSIVLKFAKGGESCVFSLGTISGGRFV
jgi:hypothetical protein